MTTHINGSATELTIPYDDGVNECREIVLQIEAAERGQFRIGEVADNLEPKHGDRTIARFAKEIGIAKCTVDRYRTVYRKWKGKLAPGPNLPSYAVLRELAKDPEEGAKILERNPNITKSEANKLMSKQKAKAEEKQKREQEDDWLKHTRKWFKELRELANEVSGKANIPDKFTPKQLENLIKAVEPGSLSYLRGAGRMLFNVANQLAELVGDEVEPFATREPRRAAAEEATIQAAAG